jgi:outer membrane protein OmpA-like peptidoglycan-associated protein
MIGYCAADKNRQVRNPEKTKEDKWGNRKDDETKVKEDQDDLIKFNIIKEKDSNIIINDKKIREFRTISLPNVQFYTNKSELLPTSKKDLDKLGIYLLENLDLRATIFGHTDNVGEKQKNLLLSQARAESVMAYLIHIGVSSDRLKAIGKGDEEPRADNTSEEGRLMNRRVEVEVVGNKNN